MLAVRLFISILASAAGVSLLADDGENVGGCSCDGDECKQDYCYERHSATGVTLPAARNSESPHGGALAMATGVPTEAAVSKQKEKPRVDGDEWKTENNITVGRFDKMGHAARAVLSASGASQHIMSFLHPYGDVQKGNVVGNVVITSKTQICYAEKIEGNLIIGEMFDGDCISEEQFPYLREITGSLRFENISRPGRVSMYRPELFWDTILGKQNEQVVRANKRHRATALSGVASGAVVTAGNSLDARIDV
eukprot:gene33-505_t